MLGRTKLFKTTFEAQVAARNGVIATLSDEAIGSLMFLSEETISDQSKITSALPEELLDFCQKYLTAKFSRGSFFKKFVIFSRPLIDGVLVGFGRDGMYYVLAAWELGEFVSWALEHTAHGEQLIFD